MGPPVDLSWRASWRAARRWARSIGVAGPREGRSRRRAMEHRTFVGASLAAVACRLTHCGSGAAKRAQSAGAAGPDVPRQPAPPMPFPVLAVMEGPNVPRQPTRPLPFLVPPSWLALEPAICPQSAPPLPLVRHTDPIPPASRCTGSLPTVAVRGARTRERRCRGERPRSVRHAGPIPPASRCTGSLRTIAVRGENP